MKYLLLMLVPAVFAADITVIPTAGKWTVKAKAGASSSDRMDTKSIALKNAGGSQVGCLATVPNGTVTFTVSSAGDYKAYAYSQTGCTGDFSISDNKAIAKKGPPSAPSIVQ